MNDELYDQTILEHARHPRGAGVPPETDRRVSLDNPFCGDAVTLGVRVDDGRIAALGCEVDGCAVCKASASMMAAKLTGGSVAALAPLRAALDAMLAGGAPDAAALGELVALAGVARFPSRRRCATLPWEALSDALG